MKTLALHMNEALKIGKNLSNFSTYSCQPKTKDELVEIISERTINDGYKCDLNDIDTSLITDTSWLFSWSDFNGNISKWDVSNVNDMHGMFSGSKFNGDISKWNVINVVNMSYMFCDAKFTGDISKWKINLRCYVTSMFSGCPIKNHLKPKLPI